jgi:hypothetical protein
MKRWKWILIPIVVFLTILFTLSIYSAEEDFFKKGKEGGIAFLSGGVGQREREILKEMGKEYSLKIFDQKNETILTVSNGPWLFIDFPFGI